MSTATALRTLQHRFGLARNGRQEERYPVRLPAIWAHRGGGRDLLIREVSFSGLAVESERALPLRHLLRCQLVLPTTQKLFVFHAMVVHQLGPADEEGGAPPAFGLLLYAQDRAARKTWSEVVQYVRAHPGEIDHDAAA